MHDSFHSQIIRFGFSEIQEWTPVSVRPCWRLYWNPTPGAFVRFRHKTFALDINSYLLMPPNTAFKQWMEQSFQSLYIHFSLGMPFDRMADCIFLQGLTPALKSRLVQLRKLAQAETRSVSGMLQLHAFLAEALATIADADWPPHPADPRIAAQMDAIDADPAAVWTTPSLASRANLSTNAFIRAFKRATGKTPQAYVRDARLELVARLLQQSGLSVEQIAEQSGFSDRNYLTRCFIRHYGCGPGTWRKRAWNEYR